MSRHGTRTFENQKRHSVAGPAALRAVHLRGGRGAAAFDLGAAVQPRGGDQCRTALEPHLHRRDSARTAGQHPFARRRAAGDLHLPLQGAFRLRFGRAAARRTDLLRAKRLARRTALRLFPRPFRRGIRPPVPRGVPPRTRQLPPDQHARYAADESRAGRDELPGPHLGSLPRRGQTQKDDPRYDPRPQTHRDLPPRSGLRRVGDTQPLSAAQPQHGLRLPPRTARRAHLPAGRTGTPHDRRQRLLRQGERQGRHPVRQLRHRGQLPHRTLGTRRPHEAPAHRPRILGARGRSRPRRPGGRHGCRHDARRRPPGRGRQGAAPADGASERHVGHDDRHGDPHGRDSRPGQPRAQRRRQLLRTGQLRPQTDDGPRFDLQAGFDARAVGRCEDVARDHLRHQQRRSGDRRPG